MYSKCGFEYAQCDRSLAHRLKFHPQNTYILMSNYNVRRIPGIGSKRVKKSFRNDTLSCIVQNLVCKTAKIIKKPSEPEMYFDHRFKIYQFQVLFWLLNSK
mmetsp:Transcript_6984/g.9677  ORF Transcript_6984/g.9677 Transcript_6984/m.9677 type:complete len:101 (-) Transcript_6984:223-525(-)